MLVVQFLIENVTRYLIEFMWKNCIFIVVVSPSDEETVIDCSILNAIQLKYEQRTAVKISLTSVVILLFLSSLWHIINLTSVQ